MNAFRQFLIYGLAGTASRLVMVFLVPLYTRALDITAYGRLEFLLAGATLFTILIGLQSESAVLREYYRAKEEDRLSELRWAALTIAGGGTAIAALIAAGLWIAGVVPAAFVPLVPLVLLIAAASQVLGIQLVLLRCDEKSVRFGSVSFADVLIAGSVSVIAILAMGWGIEGALAGILAGKVIGVALAWSSTFGRFRGSLPPRGLIGRMISYSAPIMAPSLLNWVQTNGARVILIVFLTFTDVALASVAIRVAALFGFVVYAFRLAWEPWAFRLLDDPARPDEIYDSALKLYVIAMSLIAVLAIAVSPILVAIFAPAPYASAVILCGGFILGQMWIGIANIASIGIHGSRKTGKLTTVFLAGAVVNVALLAILSPMVGVAAAMVAFLASTMTTGFVAAIISNRLHHTGFSMRLLFLTAILSIAMTAAGWAIFERSDGATLYASLPGMGLIAISGILAVAILTGLGISSNERQTALRWGRKEARTVLRAVFAKR